MAKRGKTILGVVISGEGDEMVISCALPGAEQKQVTLPIPAGVSEETLCLAAIRSVDEITELSLAEVRRSVEEKQELLLGEMMSKVRSNTGVSSDLTEQAKVVTEPTETTAGEGKVDKAEKEEKKGKPGKPGKQPEITPPEEDEDVFGESEESAEDWPGGE